MTNEPVKIGVFGGSGFYNLLENVREFSINTPYGKPSDKLAVGRYKDKTVAFLPRHGKKHQYPPHRIPYRANFYAFKTLGVERVIAPCAAGSLQPKIKPGHFVICDQLADFTKNRPDTFFDGPKTAHVPFADPYCPELRKLAQKSCRNLNIRAHSKGTVVVINGPRFATRAESRFYQKNGWEVINMTQYPEAILAREMEMCYVNISMITDYNTGIKNKNIKPVTAGEVLEVFKKNNDKVKKLIFSLIENMADSPSCGCWKMLAGAFVN